MGHEALWITKSLERRRCPAVALQGQGVNLREVARRVRGAMGAVYRLAQGLGARRS
jgi:hypothetical protein